MSVSKWRWTPECDKGICVGDCDLCDKAEEIKPKFGEWIPIGEVDKDNNQQFECSHCHAGDLHAVGVKVPYCWKCGARMVEE